MNVTATRPRYRAMRADDGWRIYDDGDKRWSEVMDRDRARRMARLLNEAPGRDEHVRWDASLSPKPAETTAPVWHTLAAPAFAVSRFGRSVRFPAGTTIRRVLGSVVGSEPFADAIRVVATDGSPFECEKTSVYRPDTDDVVQIDVPALWWVTASALRFEGAGS